MTEIKQMKETGYMTRTFFTDPILRNDVDYALEKLKAKMGKQPVWISLTDLAKAIIEGPVGFPVDSVEIKSFCRDLRFYLVNEGFYCCLRGRLAGELCVPVFKNYSAYKAFIANRPVARPGRGDSRTRYDRFLRLKPTLRGAEVIFRVNDVPPSASNTMEKLDKNQG